ncbi:MAG: SPFH domain-containing protein [Candidatus Brocadiia bacterium]
MARLDRKPAEHVAVAGLIVQLIGVIFCGVICWRTGCSCTYVLSCQLFIGAMVWLISLIRMRQVGLAEEEQMEWERMEAERAAGGARGRLFDEDEIQAFTARNRLRILNKYITPAFSLGIGLCLAAIVVLSLYFNIVVVLVDKTGIDMVWMMCIFAVTTFILFLFAKYAAGMSRQPEWRPLRACASFMMVNTLFSAVTVISHGVARFGIGDGFDDPCAYGMLAVMGIVAIEILINFVFDFYRPRVEGVEERPAYDSRLLGILVMPTGLLKTVSSTLDYQFGFRVSQTWLYRFTEQWIAPLILFDLVTLYLLSSFVVVGAEQQGVLERRGVFVAPVLTPGFHFKLPWPIERVYRFPANEVKTISLGHAGREAATDTLLWTNRHYEKEYNVMVARREADKNISEKELPVNLLVATTTIRYRIGDVKKWYYSSPEPERLLEAICEREQIKYLAGVDLFEVMSKGREEAGKTLRENMQHAADEVETRQGNGLGVDILAVGVEGMHPPVEGGVPEAFHAVIDAQTELETTRLEAEQFKEATLATAKSETAIVKLNAQSYYTTRVSVAEAEAKRFDAQNTAYGTSAEVFKAREYFSALEKGLQDPAAATADQKDAIPRKFVIGVRDMDQRVRLNMEDPVGSDIEQIEFNK